MSRKTGIRDIHKRYRENQKITALTAYDAAMAKIADDCDVDILLVGDSLGMTVLGYENTLPVTLEQSLHHTAAVARGTQKAMVIGDMPFLTYQISPEQALRNSGRYLQEAGAAGVKLEGGEAIAPTIGRLVGAGIPVLGHIGILPQSVLAQGGYRVQGRDPETAKQLLADAKAVEQAGAFAIVLEGIPRQLSREITESLDIPTIGIGAGPDCDGQIQVVHDLLGMFDDFTPRHARRYAELGELIRQALRQYCQEVRDQQFPGPEQTFE